MPRAGAGIPLAVCADGLLQIGAAAEVACDRLAGKNVLTAYRALLTADFHEIGAGHGSPPQQIAACSLPRLPHALSSPAAFSFKAILKRRASGA